MWFRVRVCGFSTNQASFNDLYRGKQFAKLVQHIGESVTGSIRLMCVCAVRRLVCAACVNVRQRQSLHSSEKRYRADWEVLD